MVILGPSIKRLMSDHFSLHQLMSLPIYQVRKSFRTAEIGLKSHSAPSTLTDDSTSPSLSAFQCHIEKGAGRESRHETVL